MKKNTRFQIGLGLLLGIISVSMPLNASSKVGEKDCNCNKPAQIDAATKSSSSNAKEVKLDAAKTKNVKAI
jgi:hypothetical protein